MDNGYEGLEHAIPHRALVRQHVQMTIRPKGAVLDHVAILVGDQEDALCPKERSALEKGKHAS